MQEERERSDAPGAGGGTEKTSRPQQAGEGETTRFGMEDGDNTEVPATGGGAAEEQEGRSG